MSESNQKVSAAPAEESVSSEVRGYTDGMYSVNVDGDKALFYVGVGEDYSAFIFPSEVKPNQDTHPGYLFIYGPYRSAEQAKKISLYHDYNPIFCSVNNPA